MLVMWVVVARFRPADRTLPSVGTATAVGAQETGWFGHLYVALPGVGGQSGQAGRTVSQLRRRAISGRVNSAPATKMVVAR